MTKKQTLKKSALIGLSILLIGAMNACKKEANEEETPTVKISK